MHVTKVQLENIKSHVESEYAFQRGTIAITGENGAGKTTIIEAIAYALFDLLDYKKDDFLRRGAKKGFVRVSFISDLDERLYTVYRDTGNGYYIFDPELNARVAEKKTDVSAFLRQHLGIEHGTDLEALFRSAIGVPQGTFTADFLRTATDRKKSFDKLLKVEEYKESSDKLRDTVRLIEDKAGELNQRIAKAEGQLAHYEDLEAEHKTVTVNLSKLDHDLASVKKEIEERTRVITEFDEAEKKVNEASKLKERLIVEREAATRRLKEKEIERDKAKTAYERLNLIEADYKGHIAAQESLDRLEKERTERDKLKNKATKIESSIAAAKSDVKRLEDAIAKAVQASIDEKALSPLIEKQEAFEKRREELIAKRAQAQSAKERLNQIENERQTLRAQYKQIKAQIEEAEKHKDAQDRLQTLQSERTEVETSLSENERAATSIQHLQSQYKDAAREVERLKREVAAHDKEIAELEKLSTLAAKAASLLTRENELTETLAHLRASKERDEKFQAEVKNGLCPILSEKCLNLGEGQTLEDYFKGQFANYKTQLATLEDERKSVNVAVKEARDAEKHLSKLERANKQRLDEGTLLEERQKALDLIESEIAALPKDAKERVKDLRQSLVLMDAELIKLREAALRYAELKPLQQRFKEIETEGKSKAKDAETVAKTADEVEKIERDILTVEQSTRDLKDPRSRAVALRNEAEREQSLQVELQSASTKLDEFQLQSDSLSEQLDRYKDLDEMWNAARQKRDATAAAYREYLTAETLAEELPQRQNEFEKAAQEQNSAVKEATEAALNYDSVFSLYDRERHAQERLYLTSAKERAAANEADYKNAEQRKTTLDQELKRLNEIRESMREEFKQKEKLNELQDATEFIRDTLRAAGPIVTESYLYNINLEANQLFREISGDAGRTLKWSRDYEIIVEEGGYERSFQNLSGGEQMAAALSLRLALLKQLSDIRVAFFDEPTVNMDAERRERLAQQIRQVQHFDQLFVISHDDTFENAVDFVVNIESQKENGAKVQAAAE